MRHVARWTSSASITRLRATKTPPNGGVDLRSRSAKLTSPVRTALAGPASRSDTDGSTPGSTLGSHMGVRRWLVLLIAAASLVGLTTAAAWTDQNADSGVVRAGATTSTATTVAPTTTTSTSTTTTSTSTTT